MAEVNPPLWLQAGTYTADRDRLLISLLVDKATNLAGTSTTMVSGVVPPLNQLQVSSTGTMTIAVSSGMCVIAEGESSPTPGGYVCYNDSPRTVIAGAADTSPRKDIVVAAVKNAEFASGASNTWEIMIVPGTPGGTAIDPSSAEITLAAGTPAWVKLARLNVGASATSITAAQIDDLRTFVAAPGGVHLSWGSPLRPASPGALAFNVTTKELLVCANGTSWTNLYTKSDWETYFSFYRAGQYYLGTTVYTPSFDVWTSLPKKTSDDTVIDDPVRVVRKSPSGWFKVSVFSVCKVPDTDIRGYVGVAITQGATVLREANLAEGTSYFNLGWISSEGSFLYNGGAALKDLDLTFTARFRKERTGTVTGTPNWARTRLIVEPIL